MVWIKLKKQPCRHRCTRLLFYCLLLCSATVWQSSQADARNASVSSDAVNVSSTAIPEALITALKEAAQQPSFSDPYIGQVWLMDMSDRLKRFVPNAQQRLRLLQQVHAQALKHELMPELVLAVIEVESHFKPKVTSKAGAQGLMQVMPFWKKEIGRPQDNLFHIETNLNYGCTILAYYLKRERYDLTRALAGYNGSLGQTSYPEKVLNAWYRHWQPK